MVRSLAWISAFRSSISFSFSEMTVLRLETSFLYWALSCVRRSSWLSLPLMSEMLFSIISTWFSRAVPCSTSVRRTAVEPEIWESSWRMLSTAVADSI